MHMEIQGAVRVVLLLLSLQNIQSDTDSIRTRNARAIPAASCTMISMAPRCAAPPGGAAHDGRMQSSSQLCACTLCPAILRLCGGQSAVSTADYGGHRDDSVEGAGRGECDSSSVEVIAASEEDMPFEQCAQVPRSAGKRLYGDSERKRERETQREMPTADSTKPGFASAEHCRAALRDILDRPGPLFWQRADAMLVLQPLAHHRPLFC